MGPEPRRKVVVDRAGRVDYLLVRVNGVSEPMPAAKTRLAGGRLSPSRFFRPRRRTDRCCQHTSWHENIEFREPLGM